MGEAPLVVDLLRLPAIAWRNGAGLTRDVLSGALDADGEPLWRLSLADISSPATYSIFPGFDRVSCVIAGRGLDLRIEGAVVRAGLGEVVAYPGESAVWADPLDGPVHNLNLFTRRGRATATMHVLRVNGTVSWPAWTAIVLLGGVADLVSGTDRAPLQLVVTGGTPWTSGFTDALVLAVTLPADA